jgi:hypothetical protein
MKEQLITFKTAKLAKEKGFQLPLSSDNNYFNNIGNIHPYSWFVDTELANYIDAVTQSLLQKWLREVHKFHINIISMKSGVTKVKYCVYITETRANYPQTPRKKGFKTYEEALEYGLFTTLNLVEL